MFTVQNNSIIFVDDAALLIEKNLSLKHSADCWFLLNIITSQSR